MANHTPGPWQVRELIPDWTIIRRIETFEIDTPNYAVCADVPGGGPIRRVADAYLIAAAPDLLAACELAVQHLDLPELRAAIAKATASEE